MSQFYTVPKIAETTSKKITASALWLPVYGSLPSGCTFNSSCMSGAVVLTVAIGIVVATSERTTVM